MRFTALACVAIGLALPARAALADGQRAQELQVQAGEEPRTAGDWLQRCEELARAIDAGELRPQDADALLGSVDEVLRFALAAAPGAFQRARRGSDALPDRAPDAAPPPIELGGTVAELRTAQQTLYDARMRLFSFLTPATRETLTRSGVAGVRQLELELEYLRRGLLYQRVALPEGVRQIERDLRRAPVPTVLGALVLLFAVAVFHSWRRWAAEGLPRLRQLARRAWRNQSAGRPIRRAIFYFERIRRPLEWLALLLLFFHLIDVPELHELEVGVGIVVRWLLFAWLAVSLADAIASGEDGWGRETRNLRRLRSLQILAGWGVVLGLGLELSEHVAGKGTLYAWIWHLFGYLIVPVALSLILVWRPAIRRRLEHEVRFSDWVARLSRRRGFFGDLVCTVGGLVYLIFLDVRRFALRLVRRSALGRSLVAEALRQSMTHSEEADAERPELDAELRKRWLHDESLVDSALADELREVLDRLERGWTSLALIGERGSGKSTFLRRLVKEFDGQALVLNCPHGGEREAYGALCRGLEIEDEEPSWETVLARVKSQGIRLIAWDDLHRITRPVLGGQRELNRLIEGLAPLQGVPIVVTLDSAAWEYVGRLREGTLTGSSAVELPAWNEQEIGELLQVRARAAGMEIDYGDLTFPRLLLEQNVDSPEEGVQASYRRILWAESDGNPEVALRLVLDHMVEKEDGDALLFLPRSPAASELDGMTLVELLVLRFLVQTDGATLNEIVVGLRYPHVVVRSALDGAQMRGLLDENHGRYRVSWKWFRTVTRVLSRRNLLASARHRDESVENPIGPRRTPARRIGGAR